jgi:hypothetical protein
MAGRVGLAAVRLRFGDPQPDHLAAEPSAKQLANQPGRGDIRRLRKEFRFKPHHSSLLHISPRHQALAAMGQRRLSRAAEFPYSRKNRG